VFYSVYVAESLKGNINNSGDFDRYAKQGAISAVVGYGKENSVMSYISAPMGKPLYYNKTAVSSGTRAFLIKASIFSSSASSMSPVYLTDY
ncbi:MAG: hypothetical protein IJM69_01450, partial [Firmicutes bacterium]|nr:hypothetical protein [Bacillota bacterium]